MRLTGALGVIFLRSFMSSIKRLFFCVATPLVLTSCTFATPQTQSFAISENAAQLAERLYKQASKCWLGEQSPIAVRAIVELSKKDNEYLLIADWYESDIGRTRFLETRIFEDLNGANVVALENYRTGALQIMEQWLNGSVNCHNELYQW